MAKKKTDFEWGARSAIQKAIRRGDVPMGRRAVEVLFSREPSWFSWRMPAIVPEEVWQVADSVPEILWKLKAIKNEDGVEAAAAEASAWVTSLCRMAKNRDANGLTIVAEEDWFRKVKIERLPPLRAQQLRMQRRAMRMHRYGDSTTFFDAFKLPRRRIPKERLKYVRAAQDRYDLGGMEGDQRMLMALSIIAVTEPEIKVPESWELTHSDLKPYTGDWPWYVYDMHTRVGKAAMYRYLQEHRIRMRVSDFRLLWFVRESGRIDIQDENAFWWPFFVSLFNKYAKITQEEWDETHAPALKKIIEEELAKSDR